jgi:hypothetical protein
MANVHDVLKQMYTLLTFKFQHEVLLQKVTR